MEAALNSLAAHLHDASTKRSERLVIGIAGMPGSGKTTFAHKLVRKLNELAGREDTIFVGMDGWHYSRAELDQFPDPVEAHARRGAPHTFNAASFVKFLSALHQKSDASVFAPSFHHERKDPEYDAIEVKPSHRIVVVEGIYLGMQSPEPWNQAAELFDEIHVLQIRPDLARDRIIKRHVQTGLADDETGAAQRADQNDLPNGLYMLEHLYKDRVTSEITSVNEAEFAA